MWFWKKWCFACKADFWNGPLFFIWTQRPYFKSYFCRPYKDALPVLVTLSHLARISFYCSRSWQKQCFVSNSYFLNGPHSLIWTVTYCFYFFFSQIICIYITYHSDTKISSTEVTLIFAIVSNFSDFPLHSVQKCLKTVVLLDRPPFVPSVGDIVFLLLNSKVM